MDQLEQFQKAIEILESQRSLLGDAATDAAIEAVRQKSMPNRGKDGHLAGERKLVTIMFADVSGFTQLSERLDPEEVRELMNDCFDHLVPVVQKYEGTVDKFIGDEIMALFGAPKAHERHVEMACHAALDLFATIDAFNRQKDVNLALHIGINTGLVIAGGIGSEGRQSYSVMGDAVNLAARLKDAAGSGATYVGADVHDLAQAFFHFAPLPPILLKGKSEPIRIYRLQSRREQTKRFQQSAMRSNLIGRTSDLRMLSQIFLNVTNGQGSRVAVVGESGIGKSRLVSEARQSTNGEVAWVEGRALSYTRQHIYQPAIEILMKLLDAPAGVESEQLKSLLERNLENMLGVKGRDLLPFLGRMVQLPLTEEEEVDVKYLKAEALRERIFSAFTRFLEAHCQRRPLITVWEDLHWSDPSSLALIEKIMPLCDQSPLVMVLIFRPRKQERIWTLHCESVEKFKEGYQTVHLHPLSSQNSGQLIRNLIRLDNVSAEVEKLIFDRAEGNPFFVEELIRSLLDKGLLYLEKNEIKGTPALEKVQLPSTLHGVVASRIDQLPSNAKYVLQTASVIGRIFDDLILSSLCQRLKPDLELGVILHKLIELELIRERKDSGPNAAYIFKHVTTHEVAYQSLLQADRKRLHRLAGEAIEHMRGTHGDDHAETLAHHFEHAEEPEKAIHYLQLAALKSKKAHSNEEAITLYQRAIDQVQLLLNAGGDTDGHDASLSQLLESLADVLELTGQYEQAKQTYQPAIDSIGDAESLHLARLHRKLGLCHMASSQFAVIQDYLDKAEGLLAQHAQTRDAAWWHEWLEIMLEHATLCYWTNQVDTMKSVAAKIRSVIDLHGNDQQKLRLYNALVLMRFRIESYLVSAETVALAEEMILISNKTINLRDKCQAEFLYAFTYLWHNAIEESIPPMESSLGYAENIGDKLLRTRNLTYLTIAHRRLGHLDLVAEYASRTFKSAKEIGMAEYMGTARANQAWLARRRGENQRVEPLATEALTYWGKVQHNHSSKAFVWTLAFPLAAHHLAKGNLSAAVQQFSEMLQPSRKIFEGDLQQQMQQVVEWYHGHKTDRLQDAIRETLGLAEKLKYL